MRSNLANLSNKDVSNKVKSLAVAWAFNTFAFSIVYPFIPLYLNQTRGIPLKTVGLIYPIMGLATIISGPISGVLADSIGRRKLIIWGPLGRGLAFLFLALLAYLNAPFYLIALGLFGSSVLGTFFQSGSNAYVTDIVIQEDRTTAFSTLRVGLNIGWMLGPALGAFLAENPFWILFALTAVLCVVTSFISKISCSESLVPVVQKKHSKAFFSILFSDHLLLTILVFSLLMFLSVSQFVSTLAVFATKNVHITKNWLGYLFTINGAIVIIFLVPVNKLLNKMNQTLRISFGALFYAIGLFSFGLAPLWSATTIGFFQARWLSLVFSIVIITISEIMTIPAIITLIGKLAPSDKIGRYMGVYGLFVGLGWAVGPYLGTLVYEFWPNSPIRLWALLSSGAFIAFVGFLALSFSKNKRLY